MPLILPEPILADAGAVVGLLVLIFSIVGWLVNLANNQNNPPPAQQKRPRPQRKQAKRVQNEIDVFLREVRGDAMVDEDDVVLESVPPQEQRRKKRQPAREPAEQSERKRRLASHVESHVGESLSRHHLESHVGSQPTRKESSPGAVGEMVALQRGSTKAPPILGLLKSRQGIRQAILVNEVLSKPKALRDED